VSDKSGRATSVLKELVGYEQSDAGFSQLVSAMEKDGQIVREIRGKRTFTITGTAPGKESSVPIEHDGGKINYDELATALLARTAKVLANAQEPADAAGWARRRIEQLERRIDELERELARARAEAKTFTDERDELRGQLEAASHNLNLLAEQSGKPKQGRAVDRLGSEEQALLYDLRSRRRS
jgi:chromosome segregation ATPase